MGDGGGEDGVVPAVEEVAVETVACWLLVNYFEERKGREKDMYL